MDSSRELEERLTGNPGIDLLMDRSIALLKIKTAGQGGEADMIFK
jgi:hypothetical protein